MKQESQLSTGQQANAGQAIVEYILMLLLAIATVVAINGSLSGSVRSLWRTMVNDVAGPCPGCNTVNPVR